MEFDHLLLWIESQPASIIALIAFGACYLCAATVFVIAQLLISKRIANELKATTPNTYHVDALVRSYRAGDRVRRVPGMD